MAGAATFLMAQFLDWVAARPRRAAEARAAWASTCPLNCAWEDALAEGLVALTPGGGVVLTAAGRARRRAAMSGTSHDALIRDQFTRQATVFNSAAPIASEEALRMIVAAAAPGPDDRVLDVACGGGLVAGAFAPHVRHATGLDATPAMLDQARRAAAEKRLANTSWDEGEVTALPYPDASFTIVVTRFSFHHFLDPLAALREMVRVCAPGGRIVVADTCPAEDPDKAAAFNRLEKLRDPSHARALPLSEMKRLFAAAGLPEPQVRFYELRDEVKNLLARSFPNPGDEARIVAMFRQSAGDDSLGIPVHIDGETIRYAYPVAILASARPAIVS
jgi:ubiquinone/menaquinone biosynthesis C-methylase UbiE